MRRTRSGAIAGALIVALTVAGCSTAGGPAASPSTSPTPTPLVRVLEDAGIETNLTPGTYVSRLFSPALRLELGDRWYRRDSGSERAFNLRRAPTLDADMTFMSGPDFLQCGTGDVVENPDAQTLIDEIVASPLLDVSDPIQVPVGARTGTMIRFVGSGDPVPEEDFGRSNEFGCIISIGDVPFPEESLWLMLMPDAAMQLVVVDVDGTTVLIRARADTERDAFYETVLEVVEGLSLG